MLLEDHATKAGDLVSPAQMTEHDSLANAGCAYDLHGHRSAECFQQSRDRLLSVQHRRETWRSHMQGWRPAARSHRLVLHEVDCRSVKVVPEDHLVLVALHYLLGGLRLDGVRGAGHGSSFRESPKLTRFRSPTTMPFALPPTRTV